MGIYSGKRAKIFERRKTGGVDFEILRGEMERKGRIAKGYLGLQGTGDESGTMDESEKPLPCGEDLESNCRRLGTKSVNATFESL